MVRLHVLGTTELWRADGSAIGSVLAQPKRLALLAYMAAHAQLHVHRRDSLVALFWPESDEERARSALSQALHFLRRSLGDAALLRRGETELGVDRDVLWCDVAAFREAVAGGRHEDALALYRGELLPGLIVADAPAFQDWLDQERAALRELAARSATTLANAAAESGSWDAAVTWSARARELAPDDEAGVRRGIEILVAAGDRAGAVRVYEAYAARSRAEYGVEPAAATTALITALREGDAAAVLSSPHTPAPAGQPTAERAAAAVADVARSPLDPVHPLQPLHPGDDPSRRVGGRTVWRAAAVAAVVVLVVAAWVVLRARAAPAPEGAVTVVPLENRTGEERHAAIGSMATEWIVQSLIEAGFGPVSVNADASGSGTVVRGAVYLHGDSVNLQAVLQDGATGATLRTVDAVTVALREPATGVDRLRERVTAAIAALHDRRLRTWARVAGAPPSYEAYLEFVQGRDVWSRDYRRAIAHFNAAAALDTTWSLALIEAAVAHRVLGECAQTDSIAERVRPRRLTAHDRLFIEIQVAYCHGEVARAYRLVRDLHALTRGSAHGAYTLALAALDLNRIHDALAAFGEVELDRGATEIGPNFFARYALALHLAGEHDRELVIAQEGRRRFPDVPAVARAELLALAALGRSAAMLRLIDELEMLPAQVPFDPGEVFLARAAAELRRHGHPEPAAAVTQRAHEVLNRTHTGVIVDPARRLVVARALYELGDWSAAAVQARRVLEAEPGNVTARGVEGVAAARLGDTAAAADADAWLAAVADPYDFTPALWRARIAAVSGRRDDALSHLSRALRTYGYTRTFPHGESDFDALRGLTGFEALVRPRD